MESNFREVIGLAHPGQHATVNQSCTHTSIPVISSRSGIPYPSTCKRSTHAVIKLLGKYDK